MIKRLKHWWWCRWGWRRGITRERLSELAQAETVVRIKHGNRAGYMTHLPSPEDGEGMVYVQASYGFNTVYHVDDLTLVV